MNNRRNKRLWILLGLSLMCHIVVFGIWQKSKPVLTFAVQPVSLSVSLETIEVAALAPPKEATHKPTRKLNKAEQQSQVIPAPAKQPVKIFKTRTPLTDSTEPAKVSPQPITNTRVDTAEQKPDMNRARILSRLHRDFSQFFYYPPLARRRNIQGAVTLGFGINGQGTIYDIQIVKSSGYALLDMAARDAMQRLDHVDWIRDQLNDDPIQLELPVIYRLTES